MMATFKMDASLASSDDVCPICKSTAQTSPNLRFKVSSKCYHRICEGCVDRKFSAGKAKCPVALCNHMLWKRDWRTQTYEDLQVEREMDTRKRIYKILDLANLGLIEDPDPAQGWQTAFENLRAYNDYLELREELAMNLIFNTDAAATTKKLKDFELANGLRKEKDEPRQHAKPPFKNGDYPDASQLIRGLKTRYIPAPRSPYRPFDDMPHNRDYYDDMENYQSPLDLDKKLKSLEVSGYDFEAYMDEALLRAFSGLGVFIDAEKGSKADIVVA